MQRSNTCTDEELLAMGCQLVINDYLHPEYYAHFTGDRERAEDEYVQRALNLAMRTDFVACLQIQNRSPHNASIVCSFVNMERPEFYLRLITSFDECMSRVRSTAGIPQSILQVIMSLRPSRSSKLLKCIARTGSEWLHRHMAPQYVAHWQRVVGQCKPENIKYTDKFPLPIDPNNKAVLYDRLSDERSMKSTDFHAYQLGLALFLVITEMLYNNRHFYGEKPPQCRVCCKNGIAVCVPRSVDTTENFLRDPETKRTAMLLYQRLVACLNGNASVWDVIRQNFERCDGCKFVLHLLVCVNRKVGAAVDQYRDPVQTEFRGFRQYQLRCARDQRDAPSAGYCFHTEDLWNKAMQATERCATLIQLWHCCSPSEYAKLSQTGSVVRLVPIKRRRLHSMTDDASRMEWLDAINRPFDNMYRSCMDAFSRQIFSAGIHGGGSATPPADPHTQQQQQQQQQRQQRPLENIITVEPDISQYSNALGDLVFTRKFLDSIMIRSTYPRRSEPVDFVDNQQARSADLSASDSLSAMDHSQVAPSSTSLGISFDQQTHQRVLSMSYPDSVDRFNRSMLTLRNCGSPALWGDSGVLSPPWFPHFLKMFLFGGRQQLGLAVTWLYDKLYYRPFSGDSHMHLMRPEHPAFSLYRLLPLLLDGCNSSADLLFSLQCIYQMQGMVVVDKKRATARRMGVPRGGATSSSSSLRVAQPSVDGTATTDLRPTIYEEEDLYSDVSCEAFDGMEQDASRELLELDGHVMFCDELPDEVAVREPQDLTADSLNNAYDTYLRLAKFADGLDQKAGLRGQSVHQELLDIASQKESPPNMVFSGRVRSMYHMMRPFLCPSDRVFADCRMLREVWKLLVLRFELWVDHPELVCLMLEIIDTNVNTSINRNVVVETWKVWLYRRVRMVRECMSKHGMRQLTRPLDRIEGDWVCGERDCHCEMLASSYKISAEDYDKMPRKSYWNCKRYSRRLSLAVDRQLCSIDQELQAAEDLMDNDQFDDSLVPPTCNIPQRPDPNEVDGWLDCEFRVKNMHSRSLVAPRTNEVMLPETLLSVPDLMVPIPYLFYLFAADPRVPSHFRTGIMAGLRSNSVMPHLRPLPCPSHSNAPALFASGCEVMKQYADKQMTMNFSANRARRESRFTVADYGRWISAGCPEHQPATFMSSGFPVNMLVHMAVALEAMSNVPYDYNVQRAMACERPPQGADAVYCGSTMRATITNDMVLSMYDGQKLMEIVSSMNRRIPIGYRTKLIQEALPTLATPSCRTVETVRVFLNSDSRMLVESLSTIGGNVALYETQLLFDIDVVPAMASPVFVTDNCNGLERRTLGSMVRTDNYASSLFFDRTTKHPLPFSGSNGYMLTEVMNHPPMYINKPVLDQASKIWGDAALCSAADGGDVLDIMSRIISGDGVTPEKIDRWYPSEQLSGANAKLVRQYLSASV